MMNSQSVTGALRALMIDCSEHSPDNGSRACEEQINAVMGTIVVIAAVALVAGFFWGRRYLAKHRDPDADHPAGVVGDWRDRRARRRARQAAFRRELARDYVAKLEAGDPDAHEAARETNMRWKVEAGMSAYLVMLFVTVPVLIVFFAIIKHLAGG